jgi:exodeoxyribonuclease VII large subunit
VQGEGAGAEISAAIRLLNQFHLSRNRGSTGGDEPGLDLILVTRGGGSLEDLWAFNEEIVARAIFHSELPVVSAVGHEIDFSISDFVADCRAATPSAAAEIITEGVFSSCQFIGSAAERMRRLAEEQVADKIFALERMLQSMARVHPRRRTGEWSQRVDELQSTALRCVKLGFRREQLAWRTLCNRLARVRPALLFKQRRELLRQREQRLREKAGHRLNLFRDRLGSLEARLRLLGPEQVLARGYSITLEAETGKVVRDAREVSSGLKLKTRLQVGEVVSRVEEKS